jgi:peptidoglycan LD-endopeptidase CwlK
MEWNMVAQQFSGLLKSGKVCRITDYIKRLFIGEISEKSADTATPPQPGESSHSGTGWHSEFGGTAWKYDSAGIHTSESDGRLKLWRSAGEPVTARKILACFAEPIRQAANRHNVDPALIIMVIATETGAYRNNGFTGPDTFRWETHFRVNATGNTAYDGHERGDYSAGPMQIMSDTARWVNKTRRLGHDSVRLFPFFAEKPSIPPRRLGLYEPDINIDVGTAFIAHISTITRNNPLLVAAVYNAGSLRPGTGNHWHIHCHGNHLDRAAKWYGDACAVLAVTA